MGKMVTIGQVGRLCVVDKKISARRVDIAVKWQRVGIYCSQGNFLSLFLYGLCRGRQQTERLCMGPWFFCRLSWMIGNSVSVAMRTTGKIPSDSRCVDGKHQFLQATEVPSDRDEISSRQLRWMSSLDDGMYGKSECI